MSPGSAPHLRWTDEGPLAEIKGPILVTAFEGWNDAGEAASTAARYVRDHFQSAEVGTIEAEEFFDFTVSRPMVHLEDHHRHIVWPATTVYAARLPSATHDLVSLVGQEPQLRWRTFTDHVLAAAEKVQARMVVTLGALLTDVPHSRPVKVYGATDDPALGVRLDLSPSSYEGPTGIVGVLSSALREAGVPGASFWAGVPAYVSGSPSPKAALALVEKLCQVLDVHVPCTDLEIAAAAYERQVTELVAEDESTAEYVEQLEVNFDNGDNGDGFDESSRSEEEVPEDPGLLVTEVEDFLRNQPG